jgi:hypothetical protein
VEKDEAFDPTDIRFLCFRTEVSGTHSLAHLVEELWFWRAGKRRDGHDRLPTLTCHVQSVVDQASYVGFLHSDLSFSSISE